MQFRKALGEKLSALKIKSSEERVSVELVHEEDDDHDEHSIKDDKVSKVFLETNL